MEVYDNLTVYSLRRRLVKKGFNVSAFKTKMDMIEALELHDRTNCRDAPNVSPFQRMTKDELKEQMKEREMENISRYKTKFSMISALENEKNNIVTKNVTLLVNKIPPLVRN